MLRIVSLITLALLMFGSAMAQSAGSSDFPLPLGPTNTGKEFWFSFPSNWDSDAMTYKYVRLYITSNVRTSVTITAGASTQTVQTVPFGIVTADLALGDAQVITRRDESPVPPDQVYVRKGVHVVADDPIILYGINRNSYTTDGMLILPTNALGRDYVVASAADIANGVTQHLPSQFLIVAPHDTTTVTIVNPMPSPNHGPDTAFTVVLNKGDVFSSMSVGAGGDLSGALIRADKPVAVMAGQNCTYLPNANYCCCDHLEEMLLPVSAWGTVYHAVPYAERLKGDLFRIFAGEDGARIFVNGVQLATLPQVGGPQGLGWLEFLPPQRGPVEISSDKPIMVAQYNNSQRYDDVASDPFYSVLTPVDQYMGEVVFTTPGSDFTKNYVNVVCDSADYANLEIAVGDTGSWQSVRSLFGAATNTFATLHAGTRYAGKTIEIDPGVYRMRSQAPFGAYIYGFNPFDSYGYPLAANLVDLYKAKDDQIPPGITAEAAGTDGTFSGTVTDLPAEPERRSNVSTVDIDPRQSTNYALTTDPFIPGVSSSLGYRLVVKDRSKDARAVLVTYDMAGNRSYDTVTYTAAGTSGVGRQETVKSATGLELSLANPLTGGLLEAGYLLPKDGAVTLSLFDASGGAVGTLVAGRRMTAGAHTASLPVGGLSSGLYFLRLSVEGVVLSAPVVIAR